MSGEAPQLALQVDPDCVLEVVERRGEEERVIRVGPLPEPQARDLAALLLNRRDVPAAAGPWRLAIAGGVRSVLLHRRG